MVYNPYTDRRRIAQFHNRAARYNRNILARRRRIANLQRARLDRIRLYNYLRRTRPREYIDI